MWLTEGAGQVQERRAHLLYTTTQCRHDEVNNMAVCQLCTDESAGRACVLAGPNHMPSHDNNMLTAG